MYFYNAFLQFLFESQNENWFFVIFKNYFSYPWDKGIIATFLRPVYNINPPILTLTFLNSHFWDWPFHVFKHVSYNKLPISRFWDTFLTTNSPILTLTFFNSHSTKIPQFVCFLPLKMSRSDLPHTAFDKKFHKFIFLNIYKRIWKHLICHV